MMEREAMAPAAGNESDEESRMMQREAREPENAVEGDESDEGSRMKERQASEPGNVIAEGESDSESRMKERQALEPGNVVAEGESDSEFRVVEQSCQSGILEAIWYVVAAVLRYFVYHPPIESVAATRVYVNYFNRKRISEVLVKSGSGHTPVETMETDEIPLDESSETAEDDEGRHRASKDVKRKQCTIS